MMRQIIDIVDLFITKIALHIEYNVQQVLFSWRLPATHAQTPCIHWALTSAQMSWLKHCSLSCSLGTVHIIVITKIMSCLSLLWF